MSKDNRWYLEDMFKNFIDRYYVVDLLDSIGYDPNARYTKDELILFRKKVNFANVYHISCDYSCEKGEEKKINFIQGLII